MVEILATGLDLWLRAEVRESQAGRNRVLDDYAEARASYLRTAQDPANRDAQKSGGTLVVLER